MNLADVKIRVKRKFGDEAQVQITDIDITRWVNDAQQYIVSKSDSLLQKVGNANLVADQQEYSLPADLLILRSVSARYTASGVLYPLMGMSLQQFDSTIGTWDAQTATKSFPEFYHTYNNLLKLYPIPVQSIENGLRIYYSRYPVDLVNDNDIIDLPITYHNTVVDYCMQQAYEQDDSSWDAAKYNSDKVLLNLHDNSGRENRNPTGAYGTLTVLPEDL